MITGLGLVGLWGLLDRLVSSATLCDTRRMTSCDTERCDYCGADTIEGNDANGQCTVCSGDTSLLHLLRLSAAGVVRNKTNGRFEKVSKR